MTYSVYRVTAAGVPHWLGPQDPDASVSPWVGGYESRRRFDTEEEAEAQGESVHDDDACEGPVLCPQRNLT